MLVLGVIGVLVILFLGRERETDPVNSIDTDKHKTPVIMPSVGTGGYDGDPKPFIPKVQKEFSYYQNLDPVIPTAPPIGPVATLTPTQIKQLNQTFRPNKGTIDKLSNPDFLKTIN